MADAEELQARSRTADEIRTGGALGNLGEGIELTVQGVPTRLIAWPGNGYQTESVHVLTLEPGTESDLHTYDVAEVASLCHGGAGEVWLHDRWVAMAPGDLAYFPEGVEHAVRNPETASDDLVLIAQITPPQLDLYTEHGLYNVEECVIDHEAVRKEQRNAARVEWPAESALAFRETEPDVRAWKLDRKTIRAKGALFNVFMGAPFSGIGLPMRMILWPGAGSRTAGFNYAFDPDGVQDRIHTHPVSDECLVLWEGKGRFFIGDDWVDAEAGDVALAPRGVPHGHVADGDAHFGGFASPPQLDLIIPTDYYDGGRFTAPESTRLDS
jgi:quercetin dioxygenase-like cupin family protein